MERYVYLATVILLMTCGCTGDNSALTDCTTVFAGGWRKIANERAERFLGKVQEDTARCRGGKKAVVFRESPWVDWPNYWATGDERSKASSVGEEKFQLSANRRGIDGALIDLEYQRIELLKFNLFDNNDTFQAYVQGRGNTESAAKVWQQMRLPKENPFYAAVGGDGPQLCRGALIRARTLTGICNDIRNPLMGSTGQLFGRNVEFDSTFPELASNELVKNRHGDRLGLLKPDPQVISRRLLTRIQSDPAKCNDGQGLPDNSPKANCDYKKASSLNVLAAFWVQFMTHDWFSHLEEGHNGAELIATGCATEINGGVEKPLTQEQRNQLRCRPEDRIDKSLVAVNSKPASFDNRGKQYWSRAPKATANDNTAWWDASQLYGFDETSQRRVKRDPRDPAKLLLLKARLGEAGGYLPLLQASDPMNPQWAGQEATAFADNWSIGLSFFHNVFAREHNLFVDAFRARTAAAPDADCGLRDPENPDRVIRYKDVTADELFAVARLVVSAEIAKIHTLEWTPQLLYNEPVFLSMNANWQGLRKDFPEVSEILEKVAAKTLGGADKATETKWVSVLASGSGIFGLGSHVYAGQPIFAPFDPSKKDLWSLTNPDHVNGGVNHFGSPFSFPEEFVSVYRLHSMVPDLLEFRDLKRDANVVSAKIPVLETVRGKATKAMRDGGLANWGLSMGRQRAGALTLQNSPLFLQSLPIPRLPRGSGKIDVLALDIIRDRERGVPRYNEFRRQYGLKQLASFDDFIDPHLSQDAPARAEQLKLIGLLREVYGQHRCDTMKVISRAQRNDNGTAINDCLGHANGSMVDNIEDVDVVLGMLAEFTRPHGFAISETQFQVFILNASRRLFSDRFFTSSFRPEFYSRLGYDWVINNGPEKMIEKSKPNGHEIEVMPLKRVLMRTVPELAPELAPVINTFDPWARARGEYYSLDWKPRQDAQSDEAFRR